MTEHAGGNDLVIESHGHAGPAVVLVHSQSGAYGLELIRQRADKVRAFIDFCLTVIGPRAQSFTGPEGRG